MLPLVDSQQSLLDRIWDRRYLDLADLELLHDAWNTWGIYSRSNVDGEGE